MCDNLSDDREYDENCANIQLEKNRDDYKELKTVGCVVRPNKIVKSLKDELYEKFCDLRRNKIHFVKYDLHPYLPKDHPRFLEFCTSNTSKTKYKGYSLVQRDEQKEIWKYMCSICLVDLNYSLWTNNENKKLRDEYRNLFRKLKCGHEFHVKCITNYSYCPNCRQVEEKLSNNPTSPENIILNKKKEILHGYTKTIAQVRKEYENILMCEEGALEICSTPSPPRPPTPPPPSKKRPRPPQTEEETTLNQDIEFGLTFYESDVPGQVDTSVTESDRKCGDGVERAPYRMDYGQSRSSFYSGPWPIHCDEIRVQHNVRTTDEAVRIAKEQITLDPENYIIEAREEFVFPADWTTTVKTFRVKGDAVSDVRIGPGRRFVAFDMSKFKHKDNVIKTLRNNSFF